MVRTGVVRYVDTKTYSGVIRSVQGEDFFFNGRECKDDKLPSIDSLVTFEKDKDFKYTNVACLIKQIGL